MKILFLSGEFPPAQSAGSGAVAYNLALGLKNKGHEIFVIVPTEKKEEAGESSLNGLKIFRIYSHYHPRWQAWLSLYCPRSLKQIRRIIKEIRPDIVHGHNVHHLLSYHSLKIAKQNAKAVFLTAHDVMLFNYEKFFPKQGISQDSFIKKISILEQIKLAQKRYNPFRNLLIKHYLKYVDKIFAISDSLKRFMAANKIENTEVVYNAINVNDWQASSAEIKKFKKQYNLADKKVIFFGGRLSGAKGGHQLLEALALVKEKIDNIILLVVGQENEYTEEIKVLINKLKLSQQVVFTGWLTSHDLRAAYHSADVVVSPSICFEGFGMINLEAMACQKPVISSFFGGPSEVIVDGETGYLVNPYQVELMSEKIIDLLEDEGKAKRFGQAGYRRAKETFSLAEQVEKTLSFYRQYV